MSELYKRKPNTHCSVCNKPIYKRPALLVASEGKSFCSQACFGISCRKEKSCTICGKLILASLNKKTCSRACANKNREGIKYGVGSLKDKVKAQQAIKMRLLLSRGKVCERCRYDKYEILQIHHKDRNRTNNDLKNLELICPNCHYEEHFLEKSWLKNKFGGVA